MTAFDSVLRYEEPASYWTEALPLGNGFLGAMCWSDTDGRYDLSENTCWSGEPQEPLMEPDAAAWMRRTIEDVKKGDLLQANQDIRHCNSRKGNYGTQLPLGVLSVALPTSAELLERTLDLRTGIQTDTLLFSGRIFHRTAFLSHDARALVIRISSPEHALLPDLRIALAGGTGDIPAVLSASDTLHVCAQALESIHSDGKTGVHYAVSLRIVTDGVQSGFGHALSVKKAHVCTVLLTANTSMFDKDYRETTEKQLRAACSASYEEMLAQHTAEHTEKMDRCTLSLPMNRASALPTDQRILAYQQDPSDHALAALLFTYGRYLILDTSRADSLLPAALQGIWNDNRACRMGWTDDMHIDINTQMNYWPVMITGLWESELPLFSWLADILFPAGQKIAEQLYGIPDAFAAHTVSNAHGHAAPGWEGISWAFFISGGAWAVSHIREHYRYTLDRAFLKKHLHILEATARFYIGMTDTSDGGFCFAPSYSPENAFLIDGTMCTISKNASVDLTLMRYSLTAYLDSLADLGMDSPCRAEAEALLAKIPPYRIGARGEFTEWEQDFQEADPHHRHTSHLLAVYPFDTLPDTEDMRKAAARSLLLRAGAEEGSASDRRYDILNANWAAALILLYQSRIGTGKGASAIISHTLAAMTMPNGMITHAHGGNPAGGIYELDGNTGFTAGIANLMLVCRETPEHRIAVRLLPAIPAEWTFGSCSGLCAYHGHRFSLAWADGQCRVTLCGGADEEITVSCGTETRVVSCKAGLTQTLVFSYRQPSV